MGSKRTLFWRFIAIIVVAIVVLWYLNSGILQAAQAPQIVLPHITIGDKVEKGPKALVLPLQLLLLMSILSLAPYLLIMMTSFVRVSIVLSFVRTALGTQQVPPTQVIMGLSLFITLFIMMPIGKEMNKKALQPFLLGKISQAEALERASDPIKQFMIRQTREKDLLLFLELAKIPTPKSRQDVPMHAVIPAFMVSEVKTGFEIGFLIYIPFLVVDMIVASVLMSMGMFMLSPMSISLPFKLLLFVMVDGWELIIKGVVKGFH